jgi:SAM-dependent methyltransferase
MRHLTEELARHLADSYPHNHDWRIVRSKPRPCLQLWRRARRLRALYPAAEAITSFLDLSSCKGYFVIDACRRYRIERALGIDVHPLDIEASGAAALALGYDDIHFERRFLHELVAEEPEPFDVALLVNTYPYLFFGSRREPHAYRDHDRLFAHIASLVAPGGTLIFSNRTELERCPGHVRELARESGLGKLYTTAAIRAAAQKYFQIEERGRLGRIPLWRLIRTPTPQAP